LKIILVANTDWYLYNFRLSLARRLREAGYEVVLVSPHGTFVEALIDSGFRWISWDVDRRGALPWDEVLSFLRLFRIYHSEKPFIVHHFTIKPVLYGSIAARLAGVTQIINSITGRGYLFLQNTNETRFLRFWAKLLYRIALLHCGGVTTFENSDDLTFFVQQRLTSLENSRIIAGAGIDPQIFSPAPEPSGVPLIVLPARMLWDKGVGVLVDAARILKQKYTVRVALVGNLDSGNPAAIDEETIQTWVSDGIVEWWGFRENMNLVYRACHIVTLPSFGEGLPTALIEAAACERPVVTTDAPGCRNVVIDGVTGFLVPKSNPPALANSLAQLILDPQLRRSMGLAGRQFILSHFTDDIVNQSFLEIYSHFHN
jgi:glycosyltransferase involved in cell wall biosynthesis